MLFRASLWAVHAVTFSYPLTHPRALARPAPPRAEPPPAPSARSYMTIDRPYLSGPGFGPGPGRRLMHDNPLYHAQGGSTARANGSPCNSRSDCAYGNTTGRRSACTNYRGGGEVPIRRTTIDLGAGW